MSMLSSIYFEYFNCEMCSHPREMSLKVLDVSVKFGLVVDSVFGSRGDFG